MTVVQPLQFFQRVVAGKTCGNIRDVVANGDCACKRVVLVAGFLRVTATFANAFDNKRFQQTTVFANPIFLVVVVEHYGVAEGCVDCTVVHVLLQKLGVVQNQCLCRTANQGKRASNKSCRRAVATQLTRAVGKIVMDISKRFNKRRAVYGQLCAVDVDGQIPVVLEGVVADAKFACVFHRESAQTWATCKATATKNNFARAIDFHTFQSPAILERGTAERKLAVCFLPTFHHQALEVGCALESRQVHAFDRQALVHCRDDDFFAHILAVAICHVGILVGVEVKCPLEHLFPCVASRKRHARQRQNKRQSQHQNAFGCLLKIHVFLLLSNDCCKAKFAVCC